MNRRPRASRTALATLAVGTWLAGCAASPGLTPRSTVTEEIEVAPEWSRASAVSSASSGPWWRSWGDARVDTLVAEVLAHNHDLAAAASRVEAARAQLTIAGADRWPQLSGTANASRRKQIFVGFPIPGAPGGGPASSLSNSFSLGVSAAWELDLWNRLGQNQKAAVAQWQATTADFEAARLSLQARAIQSWATVLEARRLLDLAQRTVDTYRETASISESRYRRGLTSSVDVHLARTQLLSAEALRVQRGLSLDRSRRGLELLLGRYPAARIAVDAALPHLDAPPPAGMPAELLGRRPDLVAAERRLAASGASTKAARRQLLPRITLTGSAGTTSNELADLLDGNFSVWSLAAGLVQPLFQGGRLRAQVRARRAEEEVALQNYASAALRAFAEVEDALDADHRLREREEHLRAATDSAQRAASVAEDRYRRGVGSLLQVLEAQRRALESESQLVTIEAERIRQRAALHLALGGDFARIDATPANPTSPSPPASRGASR